MFYRLLPLVVTNLMECCAQGTTNGMPGTELAVQRAIALLLCTGALSGVIVMMPLLNIPACSPLPPDNFVPFQPLVRNVSAFC